MQHIRKISMAALTILILFALSHSAFAHSGRTDSSGGHTNHSTGQYHYHHGYSAHQHYDMNGDGIKDCPYNFTDKTSQSSGTSSAGASAIQKPKTESTKFTEKSSADFDSVLEFVAGTVCIGVIAYFVYRFFRKK